MADIRIDTSQLTYNWFIIQNSAGVSVTGEIDGSSPVLLEPGEYGFQQHNDGRANFTFKVTPEGTIDYDSSNDNFLSGRRTSTLIVKGFPITIDGTILSHDLTPYRLFGPDAETLKRTSTHILRLVPGALYKFQPSAKIIVANFEFQITVDGKVIYPEIYDDFLRGRGSTTLTIRGFEITIDGRILNHDLTPYRLDGNVSVLSRDRTHTLRLVPAKNYRFQPSYLFPANFEFEVTLGGTVNFPEVYDSFLMGRGTTTLTIGGFPITIDGTTLDHDLTPYNLEGNVSVLSRNSTHTLRLVPGKDYKFQPSHLFPANFKFEVTLSGKINYDTIYNDFLDGRGSTTLTIRGFEITIDGTTLDHDLEPYYLDGNVSVLSRYRTHTLKLVPGQDYKFQPSYLFPANFKFEVTLSGKINYDPSEYALCLGGLGTSTLKILGCAITIDGTALSHDLKLYYISGNTNILTRDRPHYLKLVPGQYYKLLPSSEVLAYPVFKFEVTTSGTVTYDSSNVLFLGGGGSSVLRVGGFSFTLDGRRLSHDLQLIDNAEILSRDRTHELTLMPADVHGFQPGADIPAGFKFQMALTDKVVIDSSFRDFARWADRTLTLGINLATDAALNTCLQRVVVGQVMLGNQTPFRGSVILFQQTAASSQHLGEDSTDPEGRYTIAYSLPPNVFRADLRVTVFDTSEQRRAEATIVATKVIEVVNLTVSDDDIIEPTEGRFIVRGTILLADGKPAQRVTVRAFDKDLRSQQPLGETSTNDSGNYQIPYRKEQFINLEKRTADLVVVALQRIDEEPPRFIPLATSPTLFNAPSDAVIDLVIGADSLTPVSEYDQLISNITPLLLVSGVAIADLKEDEEEDVAAGKFQDITFLVGETGIDREKIEFLVAAYQRARQWGEDPPPPNPIPSKPLRMALYGIARIRNSRDLPDLGQISKDDIKTALVQASSPERNIISVLNSEDLGDVVDLIHQKAVQQVLETPPTGEGRPPLTQVLGTALPTAADRTTLLQAYAKHNGTTEEFWKELQKLPNFQGQGKVERVQFALQASMLTQENLRLTNTLQQRFQSTRSIAKKNTEELARLIKENTDIVPEGFPGTPEEQKELYANSITGVLQGAFPTEAVAQVIASMPDASLDNVAPASVVQFLNRATDTQYVAVSEEFDMSSTHVDSFVNKYGNAVFDGISSEEKRKVIAQVKRSQRLFQVSTSPETLKVLLESKFNSANDIAQMPLSALQESLGTDISTPDLELMHQRAIAASATSMHLALMAYQSATDAHPMVIGEGLKAVPGWASLFGSLDFCDCKHCQSVYSPAAYFVDLLQFLDSHKNPPNPTPLDYLIGNSGRKIDGKRPDLPHIPLSCENTNTPIPYIDLVNEVLESYVAFGRLNRETAKDTGDATAEELSANPQYTVEAAYTKLQAALFPYNLPFDQPLEVARVYLEHLGSSRFEIMRDFGINPVQEFPTQKLLADIESLNISTKEFEIITGKEIDGDLANISVNRLYGFEDETPNLGALIAAVPEFLHRTGLSYIELVDLLKTFYINPTQQPLRRLENAEITYKEIRALLSNPSADLSPEVQAKIDQAGLTRDTFRQLVNQALGTIILYSDASDCDLTKTRIQYLDGTTINNNDAYKIQRFIRLWRKLGWSMSELDTILRALGYPRTDDSDDSVIHIDRAGIQKLAAVKKLQIDLNTPLIKLASLWADIEFKGENSLYKKLFLNRAILKLDEAFKPKPDGSVLDGSQKISDHIPALLAAFQISAADFDLIRSDANLPDDTLNLKNVSQLYRYTVLAKALKLKIKDFITLKSLTGRDPFVATEPAKTAIFVDIVHQVQTSGFSIAQLNYLYRHIWEPSSNLAPQAAATALLVKTLQDGLQKIAQENQSAPDPQGELTRSKLAALLEPTIADQTVRMVQGTGATYTTSLNQLPDGLTFPETIRISYDKTAKQLSFAGLMTETDQTTLLSLSSDPDYRAAVNRLFQQSTNFIQESTSLIDRYLAEFLNPTDAKNQLLTSSITSAGKPDAVEISRKFAYILEHLLPYLRKKLSSSFVKQTLSDNLKLDKEVTQVLLESILKTYTDTTQPAIADFLALMGDGLSAAYYNNSTFTEPPALERVDPTISFNWGQDLPHSSITVPNFSVRWTGKLLAPTSETYTFYLRTTGNPGNLKLWIDNQTIADQDTLILKAGQLYDIKVEYVRADDRVEAKAELEWSTPSTARAVIPQSQLYSGKLFTSFDLPLKSYALLHKIALLANTFKITAKELIYLSTHKDDFAGTDPNTTAVEPFNLNALPLDPSEFKAALFDQWSRLAHLFALRDSLPAGEIGLTDVFAFAATLTGTGVADKTKLSRELLKQLNIASSQNTDLISLLSTWLSVPVATVKQILQQDWSGLSNITIQTLIIDATQGLTHFINVLAKLSDLQILTLMLVAVTGWNTKEIDYLIGSQGFNLALANFKNERVLLKLQRCINLIQRLGVSAEKLFNWTTRTPDPDQARDIKNTVKAKYDEETWLTVARPLSDKLRESQKSALVAYVLVLTEIRKANVTDTNRLFEYFLIDVEMTACMRTSRIKQAISSVQLFVQRCLLNLEPGVRPSQIDVDRWQWMKNYRVWEANRKVFLYPENWIEPELRDDKSPFFKELESELLQNDVTDEVAERALQNYLYKLDQVARLEICGMFLQDDLDEVGASILHVFGRTMGGMTHNYYYRRLIDNRVWTAWEKVELDISSVQGSDEKQADGVHLLPVVWNRRLYVFWLVFNLKSKVVSTTSIAINAGQATVPPPAQKYWEIKLAWSKYEQGKWSPKQLSDEVLIADRSIFAPPGTSPTLLYLPPSQYRLKAIVTSDNLELHLVLDKTSIGKFYLDNYHRGVRASYTLGAISDITLENTRILYFMGYQGQKGLTLRISQDNKNSSVPILGSTLNYLLLPLSQNYSAPLNGSYFYQDGNIYFVRSRENVPVINQLRTQASITPKRLNNMISPESVVRRDFDKPVFNPVMEKRVINPWVMAEQQVVSRKINTIAKQYGL
jgi:hypothetical protein